MTLNFASSLYWSLPTPLGFVHRVANNPRAVRATVLSFTRHMAAGVWAAVRDGLRQAGIADHIDLAIHGGTDVASEVGAHFGCDFLTPSQLAATNATKTTAVLLRAEGSPAARQRIETYFADYLRALEHSSGNIHLYVDLRDGQHTVDGEGPGFRVVAFDGALPPDEMAAYVGLRMLGRTGPGSTQLVRTLVYEYSGFDAELAERLISFDDGDILGLPNSLGTLLDAEPLRWRNKSWVDGACVYLAGQEARHPLYEWYLALHMGPDKDEAFRAAHKRYWRACVQALMPWLEERRLRVLDSLRAPLDAILGQTGGKLQRTLRSGSVIEIDREELEYNNVVGLAYHGGLIVPPDATSQQALVVCKLAKKVRDDLAHLRPPTPQSVTALVTNMDSLLR
jgi:hypothetical protein